MPPCGPRSAICAESLERPYRHPDGRAVVWVSTRPRGRLGIETAARTGAEWASGRSSGRRDGRPHARPSGTPSTASVAGVMRLHAGGIRFGAPAQDPDTVRGPPVTRAFVPARSRAHPLASPLGASTYFSPPANVPILSCSLDAAQLNYHEATQMTR
ncbi:hypothetical protein VTO73DRAFT_2045 [Trametes versicolor]